MHGYANYYVVSCKPAIKMTASGQKHCFPCHSGVGFCGWRGHAGGATAAPLHKDGAVVAFRRARAGVYCWARVALSFRSS